jgi:hypothetical protein
MQQEDIKTLFEDKKGIISKEYYLELKADLEKYNYLDGMEYGYMAEYEVYFANNYNNKIHQRRTNANKTRQ